MRSAKLNRPSYRTAIRWIAENEDHSFSFEELRTLRVVCLVADLFGKTTKAVAEDVVRGFVEQETRARAWMERNK